MQIHTKVYCFSNELSQRTCVNRITVRIESGACDISLGESLDFGCVVKLPVSEKIRGIAIQGNRVQVEVRLLVILI